MSLLPSTFPSPSRQRRLGRGRAGRGGDERALCEGRSRVADEARLGGKGPAALI